MESIESVMRKAGDCTGLSRLTLEVWLSWVLGQDRIFLLKNPQADLSEFDAQRFWKGVGVLKDGKPLAQIMGSKEFYGLDFDVDENVLIPRPESELLVDIAKNYIERVYVNDNKLLRVLDVGTGSGAILLAILKNCSGCFGIGTDISAAALQIAYKNAKKFGLEKKVKFMEGHLIAPVDEECHVVLANLPYIGTEKYNFVSENVAKYEPEIALYGGKDGLELYRDLFRLLKKKQWKPGLIVGEFGFGQADDMESLLSQNYEPDEFEIIPDLAGIPRVFVVASKA